MMGCNGKSRDLRHVRIKTSNIIEWYVNNTSRMQITFLTQEHSRYQCMIFAPSYTKGTTDYKKWRDAYKEGTRSVCTVQIPSGVSMINILWNSNYITGTISWHLYCHVTLLTGLLGTDISFFIIGKSYDNSLPWTILRPIKYANAEIQRRMPPWPVFTDYTRFGYLIMSIETSSASLHYHIFAAIKKAFWPMDSIQKRKGYGTDLFGAVGSTGSCYRAAAYSDV